MFTIENKSTGVTSADVKSCMDLEQLQDWLFDQQLDVTSIGVQLENAKQYHEETGEYEDSAHFKALRTAYKLQSALYSLMKKKEVWLRLRSTEQAIIETFKKHLTNEEWQLVMDEAKDLRGQWIGGTS